MKIVSRCRERARYEYAESRSEVKNQNLADYNEFRRLSADASQAGISRSLAKLWRPDPVGGKMAHNRDGTVVPSDSNANAIALKYLDLARSEILERQKLGYQILIAYTGAVGVIGAWMYGKLPAVPASQVPVGGVAIGQVVGSQIAASQLSIGPVPIALVVAFLAFAASWIIYDNELMITALAKYQRKAMADYFERVLPDIKLWEGSDELKAAASRRHSSLHYFFQGVVLVLPALIAVGLQRKYDFHHDCALQALEALLIFGAATVSILTLLQRKSLRQ